jgi:hypothetical protein
MALLRSMGVVECERVEPVGEGRPFGVVTTEAHGVSLRL